MLAWIPAVVITIFGSLELMLCRPEPSNDGQRKAERKSAIRAGRFAISVILSLIQIFKLCEVLLRHNNEGRILSLADVLSPLTKFVTFVSQFTCHLPLPFTYCNTALLLYAKAFAILKLLTIMKIAALAFATRPGGHPALGLQLGFWLVVAICELFPFLRTISKYGAAEVSTTDSQ